MSVLVKVGDTILDHDKVTRGRLVTVFQVTGSRVVGYPKDEPSKPHVRVPLDQIHPHAPHLNRVTGWSIVPAPPAKRRW